MKPGRETPWVLLVGTRSLSERWVVSAFGPAVCPVQSPAVTLGARMGGPGPGLGASFPMKVVFSKWKMLEIAGETPGLGHSQAWRDGDGNGRAAALSSLGHRRRGCRVGRGGGGQAQEALVGPSVEDCALTRSLHMPPPHLSPHLSPHPLFPIHIQWLGLGWFAFVLRAGCSNHSPSASSSLF